MKFIFSFHSTIYQALIDYNAAISVFFDFQYLSEKGPVVASHQLVLSYLIDVYLAFKTQMMRVINLEILRCHTTSTVIFVKSNVHSNYTRQNISYSRALLFNFYVFQGHATGISQTLLLLIVIQTHPNFRHLLIYQWHVIQTKIQSIEFPIRLV